MGRPFKYAPGQTVANGKITVLDVISQGAGKKAKVTISCSFCGSVKTIVSGHLHKMRSCGCMKHDSTYWKSVGAKNKPWQLPSGEAAFNQLYYGYAVRADKRGYEFLLSREEFRDLVVRPCVYCGSCCEATSKGLGKTSGDFMYTGVDRANNCKGYTVENSVSCCSRCNWMKHAMDSDDFLAHIGRIYAYQTTTKLEDGYCA